MTTPDLQDELRKIAGILQERSWQMGTAESCTGGAIAVACTDLPGSSAWFAGALVTYTIPWKEQLLDVPAETIAEQGVVSEAVVSAMLDGLRKRMGVQAGIAVSGIAGPTGAEPGKPLGTVVVGVDAGNRRSLETCHFQGDRLQVRAETVRHAIRTLLALLKT